MKIMMNTKITNRFIFITTTIFIAAVSRLFPHIPNFTPIAAMALFGGVYFSDKKLSFIIPLLSMFISDFFLGFHSTMIYVYLGFIMTSLIGIMIKKVSFLSVTAGSILSSILFFLITNFGVWVGSGTGLAGLSNTYILGIPFFGPTLVGDLFFNSILFGSFYLAKVKMPILIKS